jgi:hypothetical protein
MNPVPVTEIGIFPPECVAVDGRSDPLKSNLKVPDMAYVISRTQTSYKSTHFLLVQSHTQVEFRFSHIMDIIGVVASIGSLLGLSRQILNLLRAKRNVQNSDIVKDAVRSLYNEVDHFLRVLQTLEKDLKDPVLHNAFRLGGPSVQEHQQYLRRSIADCQTVMQDVQLGVGKVTQAKRFRLFDQMDANDRRSKLELFSQKVAAHRQIMTLTLEQINMYVLQ